MERRQGRHNQAPFTFSASPAVSSLLSPLFFGPLVAFAFEKLLVYQKSVDFDDAMPLSVSYKNLEAC